MVPSALRRKKSSESSREGSHPTPLRRSTFGPRFHKSRVKVAQRICATDGNAAIAVRRCRRPNSRSGTLCSRLAIRAVSLPAAAISVLLTLPMIEAAAARVHPSAHAEYWLAPVAGLLLLLPTGHCRPIAVRRRAPKLPAGSARACHVVSPHSGRSRTQLAGHKQSDKSLPETCHRAEHGSARDASIAFIQQAVHLAEVGAWVVREPKRHARFISAFRPALGATATMEPYAFR